MIIYSRGAADTYPVTKEEAKIHLRVDGTTEDTYIESLIKVATTLCEAYAGLSFMERERTIKIDSFYGKDLILPYGPVTTLDSIEYIDDDDAPQVVPEADYTLDMSSGIAKVRITDSWPTSNRTLNNVVITYTAGYADAADVSEVVKQAIKSTVAMMYEHRGDEEKPGGLSWLAMDLLDTVKVYWNAEA